LLRSIDSERRADNAVYVRQRSQLYSYFSTHCNDNYMLYSDELNYASRPLLLHVRAELVFGPQHEETSGVDESICESIRDRIDGRFVSADKSPRSSLDGVQGRTSSVTSPRAQISTSAPQATFLSRYNDQLHHRAGPSTRQQLA